MDSHAVLRLIPLLLIAALTGPTPVLAAKRVLVIEGRALDQDGVPVSGVRIDAHGSRQASATTDRSGEFSLSMSLPDAAELGKAPVAITVRATRAGWRFAVVGDEGDLGLEVRVERDPGGAERCVARSNDARVAAGAARVVSLDGDAKAVAAVNFQGQRGEAPPPAAPALRQVAKVALTGGMPRVETSQVAEPPAVAGPVASAAPGPEVQTPAGPESPRPSTPRAAAAKASAAKAPAARSTVSSPGSNDARARARRERELREQELARIREQSRGAMPAFEDLAPAPANADTARTAPPPAKTTAAKTPPAPAERPASPAAAAEVVPTRTDVPPETPSPPARKNRITPAPQSVGRERSGAPFVISRRPWPFPPEAAADSCQCRLEGTVEVASPRPLPSRVPLTVRLEDSPQHADDIELFMGSPRRFLLGRVPCGPHTIRLDIRSGLDFDVTSREPLTVMCDPGRIHQFRIVLKPR